MTACDAAEKGQREPRGIIFLTGTGFRGLRLKVDLQLVSAEAA